MAEDKNKPPVYVVSAGHPSSKITLQGRPKKVFGLDISINYLIAQRANGF